MNPRIAALSSLIAVAVVGGVTFSVYAPNAGTRAADLEDGGIAGPNRVFTCAVRVHPDCQAQFGVKRYETVRFPVYLGAVVNGARDVVLPPRLREFADECIRVLDWEECDSDPVGTYPAVAAKWDDAVPLSLARTASKWRIPNCRLSDGGWDDQMGEDGGATPDCRLDGVRWAGCNVLPRARLVGTQCLDSPTGVLTGTDKVEDSL